LTADLIPHLSRAVAKNNSNLIFVKDPSSAFPSKEMMQALRDLGITTGPDGLMSLVPALNNFDGGATHGKDNSTSPSGTAGSDGQSGSANIQPDPNPDMPGIKNKKDTLTLVTDPFSIENDNDGKANPLGDNVDGRTD
jgi:hypothetical protein